MALLLDGHLAQPEACRRGPRPDQGHRAPADGAIEARPRGLAINRHALTAKLPACLLPYPLQPAETAGPKRVGVQARAHPRTRIMCWNAMGQGSEALSPGLRCSSIRCQSDPGVGTTHHRTHRHDDHSQQQVPRRPISPWIGKQSTVVHQRAESRGLHGRPPHTSLSVMFSLVNSRMEFPEA
jgi:hypothetical protein